MHEYKSPEFLMLTQALFLDSLDFESLYYQLFDEGNKGYITKEELGIILHKAFNMDGLDADALFEEVDLNQDGRICFGKLLCCLLY